MLTIYFGEQRDGRVKLTSDRDCLPPDIIRFSERVFPDYDSVLAVAEKMWLRGFTVCVDTERGVVDYEH